MNSSLLLLANKIDLNVIGLTQSYTTPSGITWSLFISSIGSPWSFLLLTIAVAMLFWLYKKPYSLIQFFVTLGVGSLSVFLIKIMIARPRPMEALVNIDGYSFPSGHATIATIFCSLFVFAYKDHIENIFFKSVFVFSLFLCAAAISFSRIYLSVHYLSDVIVGILLGLMISSMSVFIFENLFKKKEKRN